MQARLRRAAVFEGIGLHSGQRAKLTVHPAPLGQGVLFRRLDLPLGQGDIPALWNFVRESKLCTLIANSAGASVSTIEHLMAALAGCALNDALIEIDGPEVPILDGSAAPFVRGFLDAGLENLAQPVRALRILAPVAVRDGAAEARLEPAESFEIDFRITFPDAAIGDQSLHLNLSNGTFVRELAASRTFCRQSDVEAMRARGLARGGSLENAVVVEGARVLSPGGLRHDDEPVRHKMLDALGDLALAGGPILGRYTGIRAGHALTNRLLRALFAEENAYEWVECSGQTGRKLPGIGLSRHDLALSA